MGFGAALTVGIALITQMGEQADDLRFMPEKKPGQALRWWAATLLGGPGCVLIGVLPALALLLLGFYALGLRSLHSLDAVCAAAVATTC